MRIPANGQLTPPHHNRTSVNPGTQRIAAVGRFVMIPSAWGKPTPHHARNASQAREPSDAVFARRLAPARVPPSLASPHPSGTHAPSHLIGRAGPARGRFHSRASEAGSGSLSAPHSGRRGNRTVAARASGAERKPHNPRSESPDAQGISPLPAPWPKDKRPPRPKTDSSACRFRRRFSPGLRGWACTDMRQRGPRERTTADESPTPASSDTSAGFGA